MSHDNKDVVRRLYKEIVGARDLALLEDLVAVDAIDYNAQKQGWPLGRKGFRQHVAFFHGVLRILRSPLMISSLRVSE